MINYNFNWTTPALRTISAGSFVSGNNYTIVSSGDTNFTLIGSPNSTVGTSFTANFVGTDPTAGTTGTASWIGFTALEQGSNSTSTPLTLDGHGSIGWGRDIQQNVTSLLENFAGPIAPSPFILGQTWFDSSTDTLNISSSAGNIPLASAAGNAANIFNVANPTDPTNSLTSIQAVPLGFANIHFAHINGSTSENFSTLQLISDATTGTPPLVVSSTTTVANLSSASSDASNITLVSDATSYNLTFVNGTTGKLSLDVASSLSFVPSTGILSSPIFNGNFYAPSDTIPYQGGTNLTTFVAAGTLQAYAKASGTSDAITANFNVVSATLVDGYRLTVGISSLNATTTPTFTPTLNGTPQTTRTIVKYVNNVQVHLDAGDLQGDCTLLYDATNLVWVVTSPSLTNIQVIPVIQPGSLSTIANISQITVIDVGGTPPMTEYLNMRIAQTGTYSVRFTVHNPYDHRGDFQIYRNGIAYGTFHTESGSYPSGGSYTFTESLYFNLGDTLQIFARSWRGGDYQHNQFITGFDLLVSNITFMLASMRLNIGVRL